MVFSIRVNERYLFIVVVVLNAGFKQPTDCCYVRSDFGYSTTDQNE